MSGITVFISYSHDSDEHREQVLGLPNACAALSTKRYVSPYHMAVIHAGLGQRDEALQRLEKAYDDREGRMTILRVAPEFAPLRADPRFTGLLRRMKLLRPEAALRASRLQPVEALRS